MKDWKAYNYLLQTDINSISHENLIKLYSKLNSYEHEDKVNDPKNSTNWWYVFYNKRFKWLY